MSTLKAYKNSETLNTPSPNFSDKKTYTPRNRFEPKSKYIHIIY